MATKVATFWIAVVTSDTPVSWLRLVTELAVSWPTPAELLRQISARDADRLGTVLRDRDRDGRRTEEADAVEGLGSRASRVPR